MVIFLFFDGGVGTCAMGTMANPDLVVAGQLPLNPIGDDILFRFNRNDSTLFGSNCKRTHITKN